MTLLTLEDDRWIDAITRSIANDIKIQVAGLHPSCGHTCFVRVLGKKDEKHVLSLKSIMFHLKLMIYDECQKSELWSIESQGWIFELIELGSVWIISTCNQIRPRRATFDDLALLLDDSIILRIHYGATRFHDVYKYDWGSFENQDKYCTKFKNGVILDEDLHIGFAVINKPPGVPVHGYVYNAGKFKFGLFLNIQSFFTVHSSNLRLLFFCNNKIFSTMYQDSRKRHFYVRIVLDKKAKRFRFQV